MTTSDRPTAADDDLASAYLDDEADADERARVEADPVLRARVDQLRAAADAVAASTAPLDPPQADALVARALDAADAPVVPLAPGRRSVRSRLPDASSAAALLLVVALGAVILAGLGWALTSDGGSDDAETSSGAPTEQSSADADNGGGESGAADSPDAATTTSASNDLGSSQERTAARILDPLGDFASDDELEAILADLETNEFQSGSPEETGDRREADAVDRCASAVLAQLPEPGRLVGATTATVAGEPVLVFAHRIDDRTQLSAADAETCRIRFAVQR